MDKINTEVQNVTNSNKNNKTKKILFSSAIVVILLLFGISSQFAYVVLKNNKIYKHVYVNNFYASGLTVEELRQKLSNQFDDALQEETITISAGEKSHTIKFSDIKASYDIDGACKAAYKTGREGNVFSRLWTIYRASKEPTYLKMSVLYDDNSIEKVIEQFRSKVFLPVKEARFSLDSQTPYIVTGRHGEDIDADRLRKQIISAVQEAKTTSLQTDIIYTSPRPVDIDMLYKELNTQPENATIKSLGKTYNIIAHKQGMKISKEDLESFIKRIIAQEDTKFDIPVEFVIPEITTQILSANIFKDTLSSYSTQFSTNDQNGRNRAVNIGIACSKIDGTILAPGDEFSFNKVVGPRTEKLGYMPAHTYTGGRVVDGVGGGICQVSSTLYNAVLLADLEVTDRKNHIFTVSYVPKGLDATVSYNSVDFKFRNNTKYPVKINAWVTADNKVHFKLIGTQENQNKKIEYIPKIIKQTDFSVKYIDDPTLPQGTTKIKQKGMTGYVVEVYKIVKVDGKEISNQKLYTNTYRPLTQEVLRGTKKTVPPSSPVPSPAPSTSPSAPPPTPKPSQLPAEDDIPDTELPPPDAH